tara:strand:- start:383 stop:625 length:243 start_codon:yes stop_codon:yes gene_type:complete
MVKISDILARMPNCKARVADLVLQLDTDDQFSLLGQDVEELSDTLSKWYDTHVEDVWQNDMQDLREHLDMLNARLAVPSE